MSLAKGTRLGPYEVESLLGAGGMGEVYRARDTRLDRIVAVKVLPPGLTGSSDHRARFEREARAISALSNPHICAIYDVGRADDTEYLVMEYLEGETLADRIARGMLPLSQVLRYGAEIAEALQHAHRAGITHRDLKPGNVMLTSSGVKLLDFGLAKLVTLDPLRSADAPTVVNPITAEGMIVGTVVYMSPEQLEGKNVDHRTDIFALGCILYEMTTGRRPFNGSSQMSLIAAILSSDPAPVRSLQPASPPALERIILTALEKNPDDRWQTAHDVGRQLRWLNESSSSIETAVAGPPPAAPSRRMLIAVLVAAVLGGLAVWAMNRAFSARSDSPLVARLILPIPPDVAPILLPDTPNYALSPDGRTLCLAAARDGVRALFLRRLDSLEVTKVEGSENAGAPFWSSDGQWIGFSAAGKLWKTKVGGRAVPEVICDVSGDGAVASWVGETILFADRPPGRVEVYRVAARGGLPVRQTTLKAGEWRHGWPRLLPDGHHFLYQAANSGSLDRQLILGSLDSTESVVLLKNVSQATVVGPGNLAYVRDAKLLTQHFDPDKATMLGEPTLVANDVEYFYPSGRADFDASDGVIVFRTDTSTGRLVVTDRKGTTRVLDDKGLFDRLSLNVSPDGKRVAVTVLDRATGLGDIWAYELSRGVRDRITSEPGLAIMPVWSLDGGSIIYSAAGRTLPRLVRRSLSSAKIEELKAEGNFQFAGSLARDGSALYYTRSERETKEDIMRLDLRTGKSEPLLASGFNEFDPRISPDGHWLALSSDATGTYEVYLKSLTSRGIADIRISTSGGRRPRWRGDGQELFYISEAKGVMSVTPRAPDNWSEPIITTLFSCPSDTINFDVTPDGRTLLFVQGARGPSDSLFQLVLGWQ